jgi:hypothetical protein
MEKLGLNQEGYCGERIDIDQAMERLIGFAERDGWTLESIPVREGHVFHGLKRLQGNGASSRSIYISTGIHGDEPAGPRALLHLFENRLWPEGMDLYVCPCLNPIGFRLNRRENVDGHDLNRDYRNPSTTETQVHLDWMSRQPSFDLAICLHEDWESTGFYLYELQGDGVLSLAATIIEEVRKVCPIDSASEIEGMPASNGVIHPVKIPLQRPEWPEVFYIFTEKTHISYTLESPSDFPLDTRVEALVNGVLGALSSLASSS